MVCDRQSRTEGKAQIMFTSVTEFSNVKTKVYSEVIEN